MKIGLSSYSLQADISSGKKTILDAMTYASEMGAACFEVVPIDFSLYEEQTGRMDERMIAAVRERAAALHLPISNYAVGSNLAQKDPAARRTEIERLCRHVDVAAGIGSPYMRHDVCAWRGNLTDNTATAYEALLPYAVEGCIAVAEYAAQYGITMLTENHGYFMNGADRVLRLVEQVGRDNFGLLLDVGNFICVDECPTVAVKKCARYAKMVHLKDFYVRNAAGGAPFGRMVASGIGGGWFPTASGTAMLRGAILGQGDLDLPAILRYVREAGYDGDISLEFEGMEPCETGCAIGLKSARWLWENAAN